MDSPLVKLLNQGGRGYISRVASNTEDFSGHSLVILAAAVDSQSRYSPLEAISALFKANPKVAFIETGLRFVFSHQQLLPIM